MKVKATTQIYTNSRLLWSLTHLCPAPEWVGWANSETKRFRRLRRVIGVVLPRIEGLCSQSPHSSPIFLSPSRTWNTHQTAISVLETACSRNFPEVWLVRGQLLSARAQGILGNTVLGKWEPNIQGLYEQDSVAAGLWKRGAFPLVEASSCPARTSLPLPGASRQKTQKTFNGPIIFWEA